MATLRQTFRLYPNKTAASKMFYARKLHQLLYNAGIADRRYEWKANKKSIGYLEQQNCLPDFKKCWPEYKELYSTSLQATLKRVDFAYNRFFQGLGGIPKYKPIRKYSGWTYPSKAGWKVNADGKNGTLTLNDLDLTIKMRGQAKYWGTPTTLTITYKPGVNTWYASITVKTETPNPKYGSKSDLTYEKIVAYDLGTETAITAFNGSEFEEIANQRFTKTLETKVKAAGKEKRRKQAPNFKKGIKASKRWKKANKKESQLKRKAGLARKDWQHKVTSDLSSRYDIGVTEKLNTKGMTRKAKKGSKRKKQKAGLNKAILDVGFGTLNKMLTYKIKLKGGIVLQLPTRKLKPSQRCPECGKVHKYWAELSNRYHVCNACGFEFDRDKTSTMVMFNAANGKQPGYGTDLEKRGFSSSTSKASKHTGSMKQLGKMKRQKSRSKDGSADTPSWP
ncbi:MULTISPECIES: transposase [unclassified Moorena]|uniref:RNA-guided endonuclease InsQ/TnpB family protein n=1 Tax=unclassified Moorena TaxID=2683338 RepID=UPI0013CD685E|nr:MULTISPECIES: transposase [unclassified Moorena]NEO18151.1 transposase [Moorena sp. SIO4A5]NEP23568.1 transposase [Moorena sp. SIO3I6]NEQ57579.1 transposase [Moorena sp. SIO4A1]